MRDCQSDDERPLGHAREVTIDRRARCSCGQRGAIDRVAVEAADGDRDEFVGDDRSTRSWWVGEDDVVLEAHIDGHRMDLSGSDVPAALAQATAAGERTRVTRVAASGNLIAAQIDGEDGAPYTVSFWELREARSCEMSRSCRGVLQATGDRFTRRWK